MTSQRKLSEKAVEALQRAVPRTSVQAKGKLQKGRSMFGKFGMYLFGVDPSAIEG